MSIGNTGPWLGVLLFIGSLFTGFSQMADAAGRPKIGLALSGGGARGAAHIGVLKALEEMRIPIDYIAGTSMGSIVGGLYASGMSPDEISEAMGRIDWDGVFHDDTERQDKSFRRKQDDRLYLVKHKPGVKDGKLKLPMALVEGQKFELVLRELFLPVSLVKDFDRLPIPFRAVATDLATGGEVVLGKGDLATVVRASMAVPAAFAAVEWNGMTLVDGGMANNLPISVVRDMGADIIIAVDVSTPLLKKDEIGSVLGVVEQLTGFLTQGNTRRQIASLRQGDMLIQPSLDQAKISSSDFKRHLEARTIGEKEARLKLGSLPGKTARMALSKRAYESHRVQRPKMQSHQGSSDMERIDFVEIDNKSSIRREVLEAHFDMRPGDRFDVARIEAGIARTYGLGFFEKIGYQMLERDGKQGIRYQVREKSWGTSSVQMGLELFTAFGRGSGFNLGGAYTHGPIGANAGEWRTFFSLGEREQLITEIYYPLDPANRWFVGGDLGYQAQTFRLFQDGQAQAEYGVERFGGHMRFGRNLGDWGRLMLAYDRAGGDAEVRTGSSKAISNYDYNVGRFSLVAAVDTLDNLVFPTRGQIGNLTLHSSRRELGASSDYDQVSLTYSQLQSWGKHSLELGGILQTTLDENAPIEAMFQLGGFFKLSGLEQNALSGQHLGLLRGIYRYRLKDLIVPLYVGASLELGNTWSRTDDISLNNSHLAGSLFIAADTPLGPAFLGYGKADQGDGTLYLVLGQNWR